MNKALFKNFRAFTLLELLIVLLIIGILIAIGLYRYQSVVESGYDKDAQTALRAAMINAEAIRSVSGSDTYAQGVNPVAIDDLVGKLNNKNDGLNFLAWSNDEPSDTGTYGTHIESTPKNLLVSLQPGNDLTIFCNKSKSGTYFCLGTSSKDVSTFVVFAATELNRAFTSSSHASSLADAYCALATPTGVLPRNCGTGGGDNTSGPNNYDEGDEGWLGNQQPQTPVTPPDPDPTDPPAVEITSNPTDPTYDHDSSFSFTTTNSPTSVQCQMDSGPWDNCVSPQTYDDLDHGSHTFSVRATNVVGTTTDSFTWEIELTYPETVMASNPSGYWELNEASGNTLNNSVTGGVTGQLLGNPTRTTGRVGEGIEMDGVDDCLQFTSTGSLRSDSTVEFWFKPAVTASSYGLFGSYAYYTFYAPGNSGTLGVRKDLSETGSFSSSVTNYPMNLQAGVWYHVVAQQWRSSNTWYSTHYRNGTNPDGIGGHSGFMQDIRNPRNNTFYFGCNVPGYANFEGTVDEIAIYDNRMTDVQTHYNAAP